MFESCLPDQISGKKKACLAQAFFFPASAVHPPHWRTRHGEAGLPRRLRANAPPCPPPPPPSRGTARLQTALALPQPTSES